MNSAVNSAQAKLQAFVDSLTPQEADVVDALVQRAAEQSLAAEIASASWDTGEERSIIIVSGRGSHWHRIPLPGDLEGLNPQPLPPQPPPDVRPGPR
jgi:photosystem II stability/assembly factor-like uncharacterized protein